MLVRKYLREKREKQFEGWYGVYLQDVKKDLPKMPHGEKTESNSTARKSKLKDNRPVYPYKKDKDGWR